MENKISASWLLTFGYCEYKFYLQYVEKIEIPRTTEMQIGTEVHEIKEEEFLKEAIPTTWEELLNSVTYTITKEVLLYSKFENNVLIGKIDEIGVDNNGIYIIEDKPRARPYDSVKNQIFTYCYIFKRNFSDKTAKPIYGVLRDRDTNKLVWKDIFGIKNESIFINNLNKVKKVLNKEVKPIPTKNPNKCKACIMHHMNICKFSLAK